MNNPILIWGGVVVSFVGLVIGGIIYLEGIKSDLDSFQYIIAQQTLLINEIQDTQAQHFSQREDRFEELEVGQRNIKDTLTTSQDDLFFHIGVLTGDRYVRDHISKED